MRASPLPKSPSHLLHVLPIMRRFLCHLAGASRPWHTVSVTADCSHARLPETHGDHTADYNVVSPEYFSLLRIPIVRGRNFTENETQTDAPVAILSESTARQLWPNHNPVGKIIRWGRERSLEVIGIARDAQVAHLTQPTETYVYLTAGPQEQMFLKLLVHGSDGFGSMAKGIRATIHTLDPDFVADVTRLEDNLESSRAPSRLVAILAGSLGAFGMLLACIGVYGVVSYAVSRRTRGGAEEC